MQAPYESYKALKIDELPFQRQIDLPTDILAHEWTEYFLTPGEKGDRLLVKLAHDNGCYVTLRGKGIAAPKSLHAPRFSDAPHIVVSSKQYGPLMRVVRMLNDLIDEKLNTITKEPYTQPEDLTRTIRFDFPPSRPSRVWRELLLQKEGKLHKHVTRTTKTIISVHTPSETTAYVTVQGRSGQQLELAMEMLQEIVDQELAGLASSPVTEKKRRRSTSCSSHEHTSKKSKRQTEVIGVKNPAINQDHDAAVILCSIGSPTAESAESPKLADSSAVDAVAKEDTHDTPLRRRSSSPGTPPPRAVPRKPSTTPEPPSKPFHTEYKLQVWLDIELDEFLGLTSPPSDPKVTIPTQN